MCSKKSRIRKRSFYIGDGEKEGNDFKMSQLENQIEQLERELIHELDEWWDSFSFCMNFNKSVVDVDFGRNL